MTPCPAFRTWGLCFRPCLVDLPWEQADLLKSASIFACISGSGTCCLESGKIADSLKPRKKRPFRHILDLENDSASRLHSPIPPKPARKGIGNGKRKIGFSVGFFRFPSSWAWYGCCQMKLLRSAGIRFEARDAMIGVPCFCARCGEHQSLVPTACEKSRARSKRSHQRSGGTAYFVRGCASCRC